MEDYSCRYSSGLSPDSLSSGGYSHRIAILTGAKIQIIFKIYKKSLHFLKIMCTFAVEMVIRGCFIRVRRGNQVRILSSTRYCHPRYGKSK